MNPDFWHERWQSSRIGFHMEAVNPWLVSYWPTLDVSHGDRVFVPLCGKSLDMLWLLEQGYRVIGVEISKIAVEAFFSENRLEPLMETAGRFTRWRYDDLEILCGDFFDLEKSLLGSLDAVYDRAALIAMPPDVRPRYAAHLAGLADRKTRVQLITLEYNQLEMPGPPFSVSEDEVNRLFANNYSVECLASADVLDENVKFRDGGLTMLRELVYRLTHW
jgi:thiopurine S-methyltransferase